jgi:hypothetical protein
VQLYGDNILMIKLMQQEKKKKIHLLLGNKYDTNIIFASHYKP